MSNDMHDFPTSERVRSMFVRLGVLPNTYRLPSNQETVPMFETKYVIALIPSTGDRQAKRYWDRLAEQFIDCSMSCCHFPDTAAAQAFIPHARHSVIFGNLQVEPVQVIRA